MPDESIRIPIEFDLGEAFAQVKSFSANAMNELKKIGTNTSGLDAFNNKIKESVATTNVLPPAINKVTAAANTLNNSLKSAPASLQRLSENIKSGATQFNVIGEAGSLAGSKLGALTGVLNTTASTLPVITQTSFQAGVSFLDLGRSVLSLAGAFTSAHLIGTILGDVVRKLVNDFIQLNIGFSDGRIAAANFTQALNDIAKSADNLKNKLDFQSDIAKLKAQLRGLKGEDLNILDLGNRSEDAAKIITNEEKITQALIKTKNEAEEVAKNFLASGLASKKFQQLTLNALSTGEIPKSLIGDLPKREQQFVNQYIDVLKKLEDSKKRSSEAQSLIGKNFLQSQVDEQNRIDAINKKGVEDDKKLHDKNLKAFEKYINDTIAKGKRLASEFGDLGKIHLSILPTFSETDTRSEQLAKAKEIIKNVSNHFGKFGTKDDILKLIIPLKPESVVVPPDSNLLERTKEQIIAIYKSLRLDPVEIEVPFDPSIQTAIDIDKAASQFKGFENIFRSAIDKRLKKGSPLEQAKKDAAEVTGVVQSAVNSINASLQSIKIEGLANIGEQLGTALAGGDLKNVFQAFANTIASGLQNIGREFIRIGTVAETAKKAMKFLFDHPALAIGAGIALVAAGAALRASVSKGVGFAEGGLVFGATQGIVGEGRGTNRSNPEVISPLNKLKDFFGSFIQENFARVINAGKGGSIGGGAFNVPSVIRLYASGRDLHGAIELEKASQNRGG